MRTMLLAVATIVSVGVGACQERAANNNAKPGASGSSTTKATTASTGPSATTTASASSSSSIPIELVPKVSLGPIKLGASKTDIDKLGILEQHPQYSAMTIPYTVSYDDAGKANHIQLSLQHAPGDITLGSLTIPRKATFGEVKTLLGDCKDNPPAKGGTTSTCRGGLVVVSIGSGSPAEVWLAAVLP